jgi:hypothetical protein
MKHSMHLMYKTYCCNQTLSILGNCQNLIRTVQYTVFITLSIYPIHSCRLVTVFLWYKLPQFRLYSALIRCTFASRKHMVTTIKYLSHIKTYLKVIFMFFFTDYLLFLNIQGCADKLEEIFRSHLLYFLIFGLCTVVVGKRSSIG